MRGIYNRGILLRGFKSVIVQLSSTELKNVFTLRSNALKGTAAVILKRSCCIVNKIICALLHDDMILLFFQTDTL